MMQHLRRAAILMAILGSAAPALAHPDVSASARLVFRLDGSRLSGLSQILVFDDATSRRLIKHFDQDRNGNLAEPERSELTREMGERLSARRFFVEATRGSEPLDMPAPTAVSVDLADGKVVLTADYDWSTSPDVSGETLSVMLRDRDFTIAFRFDPELPAIIRGRPDDCGLSVSLEPREAYFGGLVIPEVLRLTCR